MYQFQLLHLFVRNTKLVVTIGIVC